MQIIRIGLVLGSLIFAPSSSLWCKDAPTPVQTANCAVDPQLPIFDLASVRPVAEKDRGLTDIGQYGSPSFHMHGASLKLLLSFSFDVQADNLINLPHGTDDAVFDVDVKTEDGTLLTYEALKPRMQQLLKQRFCLKATSGTKDVQGYVLVLSKNGPKLKPVDALSERGSGYINEHGVGGTNVEMGAFAGMLSSPAGKPVKDQTGLHGKYTLKVDFASVSDEESTLPSIFVAVKEQLGLELRPGLVQVPTLTIEHLSLVPSEN